jgi:antitoxin (DNA-binding transcriptional repressor) of toxin-antitoxin stability system
MKEIKGRNGGTLRVPEKGETMNPNGRPKKLVTLMKEVGYTKSQVEQTMVTMMGLSRKELEKIDKGEEYTILERTIAGALLKGHDKNSLFNLEMLLSRAQGKPKETVDQNITEKSIKITLNLNGEQ